MSAKLSPSVQDIDRVASGVSSLLKGKRSGSQIRSNAEGTVQRFAVQREPGEVVFVRATGAGEICQLTSRSWVADAAVMVFPFSLGSVRQPAATFRIQASLAWVALKTCPPEGG